MIKDKQDYKRFLRTEQGEATDRSTNFLWLYLKSSFQPCLRFLLLLRTCEYLRNAKSGPVSSVFYFLLKWMKYRLATRLNFTIPENVADEGLQLPHYGTIVINANARLGKHCRLHVCVNIGASGGSKAAPRFGDFVYVGPGAKIYGDIEIADRIAIAANAAVHKSFLTPDKLIGGIPAKEIGDVDITTLIKTKLA